MKITFRTPRTRPPIFQLGEDWYVDVTFGWGEAVEVEGSDFLAFLASAPRGSLVIARRLTDAEASRFRDVRMSSDHEAAAVVPLHAQRRWQRRRA